MRGHPWGIPLGAFPFENPPWRTPLCKPTCRTTLRDCHFEYTLLRLAFPSTPCCIPVRGPSHRNNNAGSLLEDTTLVMPLEDQPWWTSLGETLMGYSPWGNLVGGPHNSDPPSWTSIGGHPMLTPLVANPLGDYPWGSPHVAPSLGDPLVGTTTGRIPLRGPPVWTPLLDRNGRPHLRNPPGEYPPLCPQMGTCLLATTRGHPREPTWETPLVGTPSWH